MLLAGTLTLKLFPAPSVTLFQVVPPSVLTCTVPVSLPIVALPLARLRLTVVAPVALLPRGSRVHQVRAFGARRRADRGHRQGRGGVADRAQPVDRRLRADAGVQRVGLVAFNNAVARRGDAHWKLVLLAGTLTLKLFPAPSVTLFRSCRRRCSPAPSPCRCQSWRCRWPGSG